MKLFHRHKWHEVERRVYGRHSVPELDGPATDVVRMMSEGIYGSTKVLLQCEECGTLTTTALIGEFPGKETS